MSFVYYAHSGKTNSQFIGLFVFILASILYIIFSINFPVDPFYSLINYSIALTALASIFIIDRRANSLRQVFFFCCIIFYAIAPRIEYSYGVVYWNGSPSVLDYYSAAGIASLVGMIAFTFGSNLGENGIGRLCLTRTKKKIARKISGLRAIFLSALFLLANYYINDFSLANVFFRDSAHSNVVSLPSHFQLIFDNSLRLVPSICFVVYMLFGRRHPAVASILFIMMIIANPITGFPRWQGATLYLGALLSTAPSLISIRYFFVSALLFGGFLIFPVLGIFRTFSERVTFSWSPDWIYAGHLDSFQNFARAIELEFVTFGVQLMGVLLFFVPRSVWPGKPISSGHEVSRIGEFEHNNIAMNILGEGYVNFGFLGVFLFGFFLGFICGKLDGIYWRDSNADEKLYCFYILFLSGLVFVFRGSLLSAFAYVIGMLFVVFLVFYVTRKRLR